MGFLGKDYNRALARFRTMGQSLSWVRTTTLFPIGVTDLLETHGSALNCSSRQTPRLELFPLTSAVALGRNALDAATQVLNGFLVLIFIT